MQNVYDTLNYSTAGRCTKILQLVHKHSNSLDNMQENGYHEAIKFGAQNRRRTTNKTGKRKQL